MLQIMNTFDMLLLVLVLMPLLGLMLIVLPFPRPLLHIFEIDFGGIACSSHCERLRTVAH